MKINVIPAEKDTQFNLTEKGKTPSWWNRVVRL